MKQNSIVVFIVFCFLSFFSDNVLAQGVAVTRGPSIIPGTTEKMIRMIDGDQNSFYSYHIASKGPFFFIDKIDKKTLNPLWSTEIKFDDPRAKLVGFFYAKERVYIFSSLFDVTKNKVLLSSQVLSSSGKMQYPLRELLNVSSSENDFVHFDISMNPSKSKFLIKTCHKPEKTSPYTTDFNQITLDKVQTVSKETVAGPFFEYNESEMASLNPSDTAIRFMGYWFDDNDNIFYCYLENSGSGEKSNELKLGILKPVKQSAGSTVGSVSTALKPKIMILPVYDHYFSVANVQFYSGKPDELVIGGFLKDILIRVGIFNINIDINTARVKSNKTMMLEYNMLTTLQSLPNLPLNYKYKLDYILPAGGDLFFVGQQCRSTFVKSKPENDETHWEHEYRDVIVAKVNSKGEFAWTNELSVRNIVTTETPHTFNQYFATSGTKNINIFYNDFAKNASVYEKAGYDSKELTSTTSIPGSVFQQARISLTDGALRRTVIMQNDSLCFTPSQEGDSRFAPGAASLILPAAPGEIIFYSGLSDRRYFCKLSIKE